jgi:hypothetical protein
MSRSDPGSEQRRLADVYSAKTEGELQKLAGEAADLTDQAREILQSELSRRGLGTELQGPNVPETVTPPLVIIRRFRDLCDALLAKSIVDSAGIECILSDEHVIRMDWMLSNAIGGVKVWVRENDAQAAAELLDEAGPETFDVERVGEFRQPRCPQCQSTDVTFGETGKHLGYLTVAVGVPLPIARSDWECNSCGQKWHDPEDPPP